MNIFYWHLVQVVGSFIPTDENKKNVQNPWVLLHCFKKGTMKIFSFRWILYNLCI